MAEAKREAEEAEAERKRLVEEQDAVAVVTDGMGAGDGAGGAGGEAAFNQWEEAVDDATGQPYFYNHATGETSWERPADMPGADVEVDAAGDHEANWGVDTDAQWDGETRGDWTSGVDEATGATYYYNNVTGESSWEPPAEFVE